MTLIAAALIGAAVGGIAKGITGAVSRNAQFDENMTNLDRTISNLNRKSEDLKKVNRMNISHAMDETRDANAEIAANIANVKQVRDEKIASGARSMTSNDAINAAQAAQIQIQAHQAEGSALLRASGSGFRGMGSNMNTVENQKASGKAAVDSTLLQIKATRASSYDSLLATYTDAGRTMEAYQRQIALNNKALERRLESYRLNFDQNMAEINQSLKEVIGDRDWLDDEGRKLKNWGIFSDIFSGTMSGTENGLNIGKAFGL